MDLKDHGESRSIRRSMRAPAVEECTQRFSLGPKRNDLIDDMMASLQELLQQTWTIWGVSCLFGFQSDELQLKLYAKRLREEVAAILPHDDVTYNVEFSVVETIASRPRPEDSPPIKITVVSRSGDNDLIEKTIYTGIFMSWRTILTESSFDSATKLPLLLCRGTKSAMRAVHTIVGHMFDCQIVSLSATEDELEWLVPMMLNPTDDDEMASKKDAIRLEYRIPSLNASETINVEFEISALLKLWITKGGVYDARLPYQLNIMNTLPYAAPLGCNLIFRGLVAGRKICEHDEDETEGEYFVKAEHVSKFHQVIKTQMLSVAGLQLGLCALNKISLPSFTMMDNRIKAGSSDAMHRFLLFFNDRSLKSLHTLDYDTTQTVVSESFTP